MLVGMRLCYGELDYLVLLPKVGCRFELAMGRLASAPQFWVWICWVRIQA